MLYGTPRRTGISKNLKKVKKSAAPTIDIGAPQRETGTAGFRRGMMKALGFTYIQKKF